VKLLIVSSADPIFLNMAKFLSEQISEKHETTVVKENVKISIPKILKQRVKRAGLISGLSQFGFKVFDIFFLRKTITKDAIESLKNFDCAEIYSINSEEAKSLASRFDVVICIATSIIKQATLDVSRYGFLNVHPGIVPNYRGTGNFWAVVNKDWRNIGCTCHWMTNQIDVGRVVAITVIPPNFNSLWEMNNTAMMSGLYALSKVINEGELLEKYIDLDESQSCYYSWYGFGDYLKFCMSMRGVKFGR
jgi:hypothetical protein